ncbi:hypothetical protein BGZ70_006072 [Mortierella alpina]|uniref:Uncharacterized protein n=1 Tax=Mortierella alpina TaxID=64518 RepID=A0A9P6JAG3_MORAP|nr:hypothetical protein BGZ70_006072 [Mortierella alpina]
MVATCYIGLLTIAALIVCYRSRTRLRLFAAFCTCWGLTIAVAGLLRSLFIIGPVPFWLWNFIAEPIGILALMYTITSVGSGFYPLTRHRNIFWKVAMGLLVIYALMAVGHVTFYVVDRALLRHIPGADIQALWALIIRRGIRTETQLKIQETILQCRGEITDGIRFELGAKNWKDLTWVERDMYARPHHLAYAGHQMFMIFTFGWVSAYLFVPLLNHHRRRGPVGRPLDSDMMAVGVWYMTCIAIVVLAYAILNVYYFFRPDIIFEQQAQALDLCVRATIGPIFFVPAPAFLIKFYRRHLNNPSKGGTTGGGYGGRIESAGCNTGYHGSFTGPDDPLGTLAPIHSRAGSRAGYTDDTGYLKPSVDETMHQIDGGSNNRHTSLGSMYGRMRFFHSRSRGASMESNKVFNQDFESEDGPESQCTNDDHLSRPDSLHQYNSHLDAVRTMSEDSTLYQHSPVLFGSSTNRSESGDPLTGGLDPAGIELQRPQQAFTKAAFSERHPGTSWNTGSLEHERSDSGARGDFSSSPENNIDPKGDLQKHSADKREKLVGSPDTAGTTGWERGGWGRVREDSEGNNENSLSHPLEEPYPPPSPSLSPYPEDILSVSEKGLDAQKGSVDFPEPPRGRSNVEQGSSNGQGLTGLQKQLAEYRSALLPVVLAMQDHDARDPPSLTFDSRDDPHRHNGDAPYDFSSHSHYRSKLGGRGEGVAVRRLSGESPSSSGFSYIASSPNERTTSFTTTSSVSGVVQDKEKERAPGQESAANVHAVDPLHWTKHPSSPTKSPAFAMGGRTDYEDKGQLTSTQNGDKHVAGFKKKWLAGRRSTESDRQLPQSKLFEADPIASSNVSKGENKSSRYSSGNFAVEVASPVKGRAKDGRRGVFSKVLSGSGNKAGDWARPSQDMYEQDRDHSPHPPITKSEGRSSGPVHISAPSPATVEALALSSTRSRLVDEDEDRGLQYYYPDPYSSLAEFKRPHGAAPELGGSSSAKDRTVSSTPQRHPLSPRPSADGTLTDLAFLSGIKSSDGSSVAPDYVAKGPSSKLSKNTLNSRKPPKAEVVAAPVQGNFGVPASGTHASYPAPSFAAASTSLSRSGSGSKKLKSKQRGNRSKSDVPAARSSMDVGPASPVTTMTALPITATRKPSSGLAITQPAKTSLSPPPRQSWTRSKSFQGTTSAITAAILSKTIGGAIQQRSICVDTTLANEQQQGQVIAENSTPADGPRSSLSSSDSPKPGTMSPLISPTDAVFEERNNNAFSASSPPSSPPASSLSRLGGLKPRVQDHRHNSLDRETEYRTGMGKDRTGFSTAAMDLRRANSRHQRSVDNLASAYYYRRAAELSSKGNHSSSLGIKEERERQPMGTFDVSPSPSSSSSNSAARPSSPQVGGYGGFTYYGVGNGDGSSGRNSPAPQRSSSPSHRDSGSYALGPQYQKSKTSLEYSLPGGNPAHHRSSPVARMNDGPLSNTSNTINEHNRTGSLTNSHLMAEDPWTQALIARASGNHSGARPQDSAAPPSSSGSVGGAQAKYQHHQHHHHHRPTRSVDATASMDYPILVATGSHGAGGAYQKGSEPSAQ